jgi:type II secretory pathway component PulF
MRRVIFLVLIVPKFDRIFVQHNARLPSLTWAVVTASHVVSNPAGLVLGAVIIVAAWRRMGKELRRRWSGFQDRTVEREVLTVVGVVLHGALVGVTILSLCLPIFKACVLVSGHR